MPTVLDSRAKRAVVVLSGGLDSTTCLAMAVEDFGADNVFAISYNYGQRHSIELVCAGEIAAFYKLAEHKVIQLPEDIFIGGVLTDYKTEVPDMHYDELPAGEVSPTYVPNRNMNLIAMSVSYALTKDADFVFAGQHAEDAAGFAYPDCTPEFLGALAAATYVGTYHKVRLSTPFAFTTKDDIIRTGLKLGAPYHLTHSCYRNSRPACGKCSTCNARLDAFAAVGAPDQIAYEARV